MNFKSKFPRELLNEIKWKLHDLSNCVIYFDSRGSPNDIGVVKGDQIIKIDNFLVLEGDPFETYIPYHRIVKIEYCGKTIFEKVKHELK